MTHTLFGRFCAVLDILYTWIWNLKIHSTPYTYVLMYHEVGIDHLSDSCHHTIEEFKSTIDRLEKEGADFISVDHLFETNKSKFKRCVITFDDVPESFYRNAYPILREKGIPYVLFVSQNFIGMNGFLSESQIQELSKDPLCTIGAHTMTHCMLRKVENSKVEMLQSKLQLETMIGKKVDYLAYPYGKHSSISLRVRRQAKECGFKAAFGTINAPITGFSSLFKYYLPRMVVR